jgi:extracellular elastinolytic metalloproteinase
MKNRNGRPWRKLAALAAILAIPSAAYAADRSGGTRGGGGSPLGVEADPDPGNLTFDIRESGARRFEAAPRSQATRAAQARLRRSLGGGGVLRVSRLTGTPRQLLRQDGLLTAPASGSPARLVLDYVRDQADVFRLDGDDLDSLRLVREYTSTNGITQLRWAQTFRGISSLDTMLGASVTRDGRIVSVLGSPEPDLAVDSTDPQLGAREALLRAAADVGSRRPADPVGGARGPERVTRFRGGHAARLVLFVEPQRTRLAWRVRLFDDEQHLYDAVVDASSGEVLRRSNMVKHASALAFRYFPGASAGGTQTAITFSESGNDPWLTTTAELAGNNAHVYSDEDASDDASNTPDPPAEADKIPPTGGTWNYAQQTRTAAQLGGDQFCPPAGCTYNDVVEDFSWRVNRPQAGTQLFAFVNLFHDHLRDAPGIVFSEASGNFEQTNASGQGEGGDRVVAQVDNGASTETGPFSDRPACQFTNNASMLTLPDGQPAIMRMFLWSEDCDGSPPLGSADNINNVNGADDGAIVYHEYTHGLSNRLVTDPSGEGALSDPQSGAMGEGWSDWYAMDYLNAAGLQPDTAAPGEIRFGTYEGRTARSQPTDCPTTVGAPTCPGDGLAGAGGYTYGDFGKIETGPEVHADGEIWGEALWDLRRGLIGVHGAASGIRRVRAYATEGMRGSPPEPSFLDVRDAMLAANAALGLGDSGCLWGVFAARGMGSNAVSTSGFDVAPVEGFAKPSTPPCQRPVAAAATPGATPTPPAKPILSRRSIRVSRRGRFRYRFRAQPGLRARLRATTVRRVFLSARRRRRITLATRTLTVPASGRARPLFRLSRRKLRTLKRYRRLRTRVRVRVTNSAGLSATATVRITLKAPRRRRR